MILGKGYSRLLVEIEHLSGWVQKTCPPSLGFIGSILNQPYLCREVSSERTGICLGMEARSTASPQPSYGPARRGGVSNSEHSVSAGVRALGSILVLPQAMWP